MSLEGPYKVSSTCTDPVDSAACIPASDYTPSEIRS